MNMFHANPPTVGADHAGFLMMRLCSVISVRSRPKTAFHLSSVSGYGGIRGNSPLACRIGLT